MIFIFLGCTMVTLRSETLLYINTSYPPVNLPSAVPASLMTSSIVLSSSFSTSSTTKASISSEDKRRSSPKDDATNAITVIQKNNLMMMRMILSKTKDDRCRKTMPLKLWLQYKRTIWWGWFCWKMKDGLCHRQCHHSYDCNTKEQFDEDENEDDFVQDEGDSRQKTKPPKLWLHYKRTIWWGWRWFCQETKEGRHRKTTPPKLWLQ